MSVGRRLLILFAGGSLFPAIQAAPTPHAFARGYEIELAGHAPIYKLQLTAAIYQSSATADLSDLAVFNAAAEQVPHMLRAAAEAPAPAVSNWIALPFFPVPTQGATAERRIIVQTDGTLIRIEGADSHAEHDGAMDYLVDASRLQKRLTEIELALVEPGNDFVVPIQVEASSDLTKWTPLVANYHLAALEYAGHRLTQTRIPLPNGGARYLRLRALQQNAVFRIATIRGKVRSERAVVRSLVRLKVSSRSATQHPDEIRFDLGGSFPLHEVAIEFAPNKLIQATIESSSDPADAWRRRYTGALYTLERNGLLLRPNSLRLVGVRDRYWRLSGIEPMPTAALSAELTVAWKPQELIFLAEGTAPYLLAVGRATPLPEKTDYAGALEKITRPDLDANATVGSRLELGGDDKLTADQTIPWRRYLLWAILAGGVAAVGIMVVRLMRQMKVNDV
jgi:hypothetical protein